MYKSEILCYNKSIVSFVQRMTNLEELALYINQSYIIDKMIVYYEKVDIDLN